MKIGDRNGVQDPRLTGSGGIEPRRPGGASGGEHDGDDQVDVSDLSRALARLFGAANAAPDQGAERSARVAALRREVENGTYQPDPRATAQKLLLDELA